ncbi:1,6-anhydro-N-acetylmuramyl-L-alanine amidase AmpD [Mergibacter septicus]|uniref:1,6-anhydro-N-acetylmuramyl-L-alanine amidase AmpD n=1 Tax=Mergibacter septicus TaxID=221402 RepID=UPI003906CED6
MSSQHTQRDIPSNIEKYQVQQGLIFPCRYLPSPHFDLRPDPTDISLLVIHYISLPENHFGEKYIDDLFLGRLDPMAHPTFHDLKGLKVSAHCLIDRQGKLTQYVNLNHRAWHAGVSYFAGREKCNDFSIGIELEGSNHHAFTPEQYHTLIYLTQAICQTYPKITPERIVGHCHIAPNRKIDPGQYFEWDKYFNALIKTK